MDAPRKIINHIVGLRGIAIIFVVLFHIIPEYCRCGQLGVDIFFVITGYFLFSSIQVTRGGGRDLLNFYAKKFKRIYPPLIALILILTTFIVKKTLIDIHPSFGEGAVSALLGFSNEYLEANTPGYFDHNFRANIFTHTWYLAITIQLYILLPFLFLVVKKQRKYIQKLVWGTLSVISFFIYYCNTETLAHCPSCIGNIISNMGLSSCVVSNTLPYYWTSGRIWEVLLGAYISHIETKSTAPICRKLYYIIGLSMVVVPPFVLSPASMFNILTVVGSLLVLRYGAAYRSDPFLTNKLTMSLGKISFSLYLWHWPILILWKELIPNGINLTSCAIIMTISFVLSWLSWKYIESRRFSFGTIAASYLICLVASFSLACGKSWGGFPGIPKQLQTEQYHQTRICKDKRFLDGLPHSMRLPMADFYGGGSYKNSWWDNHRDAILLKIGDDNQPYSFLFAGDSHANALYPAFDIAAKQHGLAGVYLRVYMTPIMGIDWHVEYGDAMHVSPQRVEDFFCWIAQHHEFKYIIMGQWWENRYNSYTSNFKREHVGATANDADEAFEKEIERTCNRIRQMGKEPVFVMQTPVFSCAKIECFSEYINGFILRNEAIPEEGLIESEKEYLAYSERTRTLFARLERKGLCKVINPARNLFHDEGLKVLEDGVLNMRDWHHLTYRGALKVTPSIADDLQKIFWHEIHPTPKSAPILQRQ